MSRSRSASIGSAGDREDSPVFVNQINGNGHESLPHVDKREDGEETQQRFSPVKPEPQSRARSRTPRSGTRSPLRGREAPNTGHNLFVSGLSHVTEEKHLEREFGKYGKITKCAIMYDPHSRLPRGFAFVSFEDVEAADEAIKQLDMTLELHGKILRVQKAKRSRARTPTPGQYRGPPKRDDDRYDNRGYRRRYEPYDHYNDRRYDDRDRRRGYDRRYDDRDRYYDRRRSRSPRR